MKPPYQIRRRPSAEDGYILLLLLLTMALIAIAAAVIVPSITFEIKRDREEEMIHRGTQYSRAIRLYYRKFGRYPAKIEDLENTQQIRFLRKRYKDPLTGKDFRLLHYGEAKLSSNGIGGGVIPGASSVGANGALVNSAQVTTSGANTGFGSPSNSSFGSNSAFGSSSAFGSNSGFGQSSQPPSNQTTSGASQSSGSTDQAAAGNTTGSSGDQLAGRTFGGAPIVGVASLSKEPTIREFDHKKKYNEWQFVYDPTFDRGYLITTPYQPSLQALSIQGMTNLNGTNSGQNGPNNNGFGNSFGTGFGNSPSPMQNQPTTPMGGYGNQNPPNPPPQQQ